jgi:aminocarboxymuconate-semialdehyde decarboxylase
MEPSSYLRRFHVDTNVWSVPALRLLLEVLGPERLVVGNDQPPVWAPLEDALALLAGLELGERDREAVLWRNAARLFHLERLE